METITIPKEEYERLKSLEKVEWEIVGKYRKALQNLEEGKFIEC